MPAKGRADLRTETWRKKIRPYILERDGHTCVRCGKNVEGADATIDHIIPKAISGTEINDPSNLITMCRSCNSMKGTKIHTRRAGVSPRWGITLHR